jgi:signal transduction histidine kinase
VFDIGYLTLATAIANFALGLFVLSRGTKKPLNISFFAFALIDSAWALSNFYFEFINHSLLVFKSQYATGGLTLVAALLWVTYLVNQKQTKRSIAAISVLGFIFFIFPFIDGIIIKNIFPTSGGNYDFTTGALFDFYGGLLLATLGYLFFVLLRAVRKESGIRRIQLRYVLAGLSIFAAVSISFGVILPFFGINSIVAFDAQSSFLWVILTSYAIIRHRLLDIRVIFTRSLVYGVLVSIVTLTFVSITFISGQFFGQFGAGKTLTAIAVALLIVFGLEPFKRFLSRVTDRIFFKAKIDYPLALRKLTEVVSTEIDIDDLIEKLATNLATQLKIKNALLVLRSHPGPSKREVYEVRAAEHPHTPYYEIDGESPLITFLKVKHHATVLEALERRIEDTRDPKQRKELEQSRGEFEKMGAAVIAPVEAQGQLNAILALGPKLSGESYSNDDLELIAVLGPQIGSAIEKSKLYQRVKEFSQSLEQKVESATSELQERNVSLVTLQRVTRDITRTLDFNRVVQNIANAVATDLDYLGAVLVFLDDDGHTVRARAITETPLTLRATKLLPKHFSEYQSDIRDPKANSLGHEVIRSGTMRTTDSFAEVVSPPLPKMLANAVQKLVGIQSMVLIPIVSEQRVIGVMEIGSRKKLNQITEQDIATLQAMADQLGVVARNIKLFEQIRFTNNQLAEANRHLQALDQAKSEFVSIASHQLRTPMTGIMGYLSMMVGGDFGAVKPEHAKILKELLSESQRMIRLINLFLNVSKIEAGKFTIDLEPTSLSAIIEHEVGELTKEAMDKGLKLIFKHPAKPLPTMNVDADKLQDVLLNLIDNAIKYTQRGSVTVAVKELPDSVRVEVKDSGIGIKPEEARELFNKFVRGSGIAQIHPDGSGLGLFIAKRVVEAHGGRIGVESDGVGKGSTFYFELPKSAAQGRFEVGEESVTPRPPLPPNSAH